MLAPQIQLVCVPVPCRGAEALIGCRHSSCLFYDANTDMICTTCCAEPLKDYVGPIGLYGHVNDILKENMSQMKVGGWMVVPCKRFFMWLC